MKPVTLDPSVCERFVEMANRGTARPLARHWLGELVPRVLNRFFTNLIP
jgi:hypothetical protein